MLSESVKNCFSQLTYSSRHIFDGVRAVAVDTRKAQAGDLFFALPGENVDGHQFLAEASAKGAIAAVVSNSYEGPEYLPLVRVNSPLEMLQQWAREVVTASGATVIAVTGSVGKTTTKHFIGHLLSGSHRICISPGNSNSQIGLPLAVLNHTRGDEEFYVLEMGMTLPGQISRLMEIASPDIAVLTTVALLHACNFKDLAEIARAKAEILSHSRTKLAIVHRGIAAFDEIAASSRCPLLTFGWEDPFANITAIRKGEHIIVIEAGAILIELKVPPVAGKHNLHNYLAAIIAVRHLGISWNEIAERSATLTLPEKRFQLIESRGVLIVDDSYNAAPISMKAAIDAMPASQPGGRRIAVFGAMLELGNHSENSHYEVGIYALDSFDMLFCLGDECAPMERSWSSSGKPAQRFSELSALVASLKAILQSGDVVLIKGSRGSGISKVIDRILN